MTNLLDSFNPEKAKCSICKEYFDKNTLQNSRMPPGSFVIIAGLFCECCLSEIEEGELTNLLDSFNPKKAKCVGCKKYFDKSNLEKCFHYFFCDECRYTEATSDDPAITFFQTGRFDQRFFVEYGECVTITEDLIRRRLIKR